MYAEGEFEVIDYKKSLDTFIEDTINKEREQLKGKIFKRSTERNIEMLDLIEKSVDAISEITMGEIYKPSNEIMEPLQKLANLVSSEELYTITNAINTDIMTHNYSDKVRQINELSARIEKLSEKATLSNGKRLGSSSVVISDRSKTKSNNEVFKSAIEKLAKEKKKKLDADLGHIDLQQQEQAENYDAKRLIQLANSDYLESSMENMTFKRNVKEVAHQLEIRDSATKIIKACEELQEKLVNEAKDNDMNFSRIQEALSVLLQQKKKELAAANSFLKSQNVDKYLEEAKKFEQTSRENDTKNQIFGQYGDIVKEIEELKQKDPDNLDRIHELEERLESIKIANSDKDINFGEYDKKEEKAKEEYKQAQQIEEMLQNEKDEERAMMREINRNYRESLRRRAINELKLSGDYDNVNREELIREKMAEISRSEKASDDEFTRRQIQEAENKLMAIAQEELGNENIFTDEVEVIESKVAEMIASAYMTPEERCRQDMIKQGMNEREITDSLVASNAGYYKDGTSGFEHTKEIQQLVQEIGNYNASLSPVYAQDNDYSK